MPKRLQKPWTEEEVALLKEKYEIMTKWELLELFQGRSWQSIKSKAKLLGLKKSDEMITESQRLGNKYRSNVWSDEELEILRKYYPIGGYKLVQEKLPHRNKDAIQVKAHALGLKVEDREVKWERNVVVEDDGSKRAVIVTYARIN